MTLNGVMAVTLRYFTEFGKPSLQKTICGGIYAKSIIFLARVQCRRKESSRSLFHLLDEFLVTKEGGILIKVLRQSTGYSARKLLEEFPEKDWSCSALDRILRQIDPYKVCRQEVGQ